MSNELIRVARLRAEIAALARGGEYELATRLLHELAATDLRAGYVSDALRRGREAAVLARHVGGLEAEVRGELVLATSLIAARDPQGARAAAEIARTRIDQATELAPDTRSSLFALAELVYGTACRQLSDRTAARVALGAARAAAVRSRRVDVTALALVELGCLDLDELEPDRAAVCFWFARDALRLIGRHRDAGLASIAALRGFLLADRAMDAASLARSTRDDADRVGDAETGARAAGVLADALIQAGKAAAPPDDAGAGDPVLAACDDAAARAAELPEPVRRELLVGARLRQLRIERDPAQQRLHLEAALDLGLSARDAAAIAGALDAAVGALVAGELSPTIWEVVAGLARAMRASGYPGIADMAEAALEELR